LPTVVPFLQGSRAVLHQLEGRDGIEEVCDVVIAAEVEVLAP
jgi:hypothetical protein